ncbi:MAG: hypothetical protein P8090_15630 [Gammaproteobacteria bacterium]
MLWRKRQADKEAAAGRDVITPGSLAIPPDPGVFASKLEQLLEAIDEAGGVQVFIDALNVKHELFARALETEVLRNMTREGLDALLETVFTARRKLPEALGGVEQAEVNAAIEALVYGKEPLAERMQSFMEFFPLAEGEDKATQKANQKVRRAAWDFGAEMLHFLSPEKYPLMTRWVWDVNTVSGAMREFIAANDTLRESPFDGRPETFEAMRHWMVEQLSTAGFYRDVPLLIDMVLGWAYTDYMRAMSSSMGLIEAEFGGTSDRTEPLKKILGIDPARRSGQSRVKRETVH